ncbi:MAG: DUF1294 domain-containing protein [Tissierellia bacterium]|nr:DUF1294 domain-containing protein [Tissierellia bacterium]
MGYDKSMAKASGRRIPEATLILLAAIGGALGGTAGMLWFHHKISKPKFYIAFPLLAIIHVAVVFYVFLTT